MLNVHQVKHVKIYIVWILVQLQDVESMLSVKLSTIYQTVFAYKDILEIHLLHVDSLH